MRVAMEYKYMLPLSNRISLTVVIFTHSRSRRLLRAHYWAISAFAPELLFSHLFKWNSIIILRWYTFEYFLVTCEFSRAECTRRRALGVSLVCNFSYLLHITGCMWYSDCALLQVIHVLKEVSKKLFSHAMPLLKWLTWKLPAFWCADLTSKQQVQTYL